MTSNPSRAALVLVSLSFAAACGIDSALVGGRCRDGMAQEGRTCVGPAPSVTLITPTEPPADAPIVALSNDASVDVPPPVKVPDPTEKEPDRDASIDFPPPPPPPPPLVCTAPLVACHGACISVASDAANCGACGKICPSNICIAGECQGAMPGDVVLIGHDFTNAWSGSAQAKVLVNALTIPTTDPIRILSYEDGAPVSAVAQTKALAAAGIKGRAIDVTVAASASALADTDLAKRYDIVLLHDASAGDAVATGASWSTSLGGFTMRGGVVVALDRGTSPMPELLSSAGLLALTSHAVLADGTHLVVTGAADVVGAQLLSPYACFGAPVSFQGVAAQSADLGWVVRAAGPGSTLGDPVVIHRIVR
jgi:ferredoxin